MPKTKVVTEKQKRDLKLMNAMSGIEHCPTPTYYYEIGDGVAIGNLEDCIIVDILEDGKIYEVSYTSRTANYGNPIATENVRGFWQWHEIRPLHGDNHEIIFNEDLTTHETNRTISDGILGRYYHFGVDMNPKYQRDFVWSKHDDVSLIHSIFQNISIGRFIFVHKPYGEHDTSYEILDGKQRMSAIIRYYQNEYDYDGLYYNDLSKHEKNHFREYMISCAELENITLEQKLRYFIKFNISGKVMDKNNILRVQKMLEQVTGK